MIRVDFVKNNIFVFLSLRVTGQQQTVAIRRDFGNLFIIF